MTWETEVRQWLAGPMGKGMLRGEPTILDPRTPVAPLLESWAALDELDLVTETFAEDGTAHPAVVLFTRDRPGLDALPSASQVADEATAQWVADEALRPTVAALWWVTEAGSPAAWKVDVRFPPGHNDDAEPREGGAIIGRSAPRVMAQIWRDQEGAGQD